MKSAASGASKPVLRILRTSVAACFSVSKVLGLLPAASVRKTVISEPSSSKPRVAWAHTALMLRSNSSTSASPSSSQK